MAELVGSPLAVVMGNDYRAHHEVSFHELVAQAEHVFVVGDAQVGAHLILLDVFGTDDDDYLDAVAQLGKHAQLAVRLEPREYARGMMVVKELAA